MNAPACQATSQEPGVWRGDFSPHEEAKHREVRLNEGGDGPQVQWKAAQNRLIWSENDPGRVSDGEANVRVDVKQIHAWKGAMMGVESD